VELLNECGFVTCDSGDGQTGDFSCDRGFPYVMIEVHREGNAIADARRLKKVLEECGIAIHTINDGGRPYIQATFDPADGSAFVELAHVTDVMFPAFRVKR
jgi:hypothetical protein